MLLHPPFSPILHYFLFHCPHTWILCIYLYKMGSDDKCSSFPYHRLGAGMWCALIPTHMESVQGTNHKHRQARALALQLFTLRGTHICLQVKGLHTYTHACVLTDIPLRVYTAPPPPLPPWGQLPSGTSAVALDSRWEGLSACSLCCLCAPILPTPHPTVQTASWRNRCLWTVSASRIPEIPARNASAGKAMPTANPGSAPGPPVPTRCLVSVARTTVMVRRAE